MFATDFAAIILRDFKQEIERLEHHILNGALQSETDYRKAVAKRQQMLLAREIIVQRLGESHPEETRDSGLTD